MKSLFCFGFLVLAGQAFSQAPVAFYFSDAGGNNDRLFTDVVDGPNWQEEYDVVVKNVSGQTIEFNVASAFVGFAQATQPGTAATLVPGTDKVRPAFYDQATNPLGSNPNITAFPAWANPGFSPQLRGGAGGTGPLRPCMGCR